MNEEQLSEDEISFIELYITNGFNASDAYRALSPDVTEKTAASQGSRFAKKLKETQYFRNRLQEIRNNYGLSMKSQIERLELIYKRSMQGRAKLEFDREEKRMVEVEDENGNIVYEYDSRGALGAIQEMNKMVGFHKETALRLKLGNGNSDNPMQIEVVRRIIK